MTETNKRIKTILVSVLTKASKIQLDHFNKQMVITEKKSQSSVVSEVDLKCEAAIIDNMRHMLV